MHKIIKVTFIIAALIVVVILGLFLYGVIRRSLEVQGFPAYYQTLAKQCLQKGSYECCISSVNEMAQGNYELAPQTGCPEGMKRNSLLCIDAFSWCEPTNKNHSTEPAPTTQQSQPSN